MRLYDAVASDPILSDARRWYDEARSALQEVRAWGHTHIADPRVRRNFDGLHVIFWQLRLEHIWRDHLARPWLRWILKLRSLVRLVWSFLRMRGLYDD